VKGIFKTVTAVVAIGKKFEGDIVRAEAFLAKLKIRSRWCKDIW
jgi:hypothetical protein